MYLLCDVIMSDIDPEEVHTRTLTACIKGGDHLPHDPFVRLPEQPPLEIIEPDGDIARLRKIILHLNGALTGRDHIGKYFDFFSVGQLMGMGRHPVRQGTDLRSLWTKR